MHPCQGNWVAIGRAVVYCARAAHASCAELNAGTVLPIVHQNIIFSFSHTASDFYLFCIGQNGSILYLQRNLEFDIHFVLTCLDGLVV